MDDPPPDVKPGPRQPTTFYVGPEAQFPTLRTLLNTGKLQPGDSIIVQAPEIHEGLHLDTKMTRTLKNVVIEADPKFKEVVWKKAKEQVAPARIVFLEDAEDITIKGFTFDGEGKAESLIQLACNCRNVKLENVKLRGFTKTGIRFTNCMATREKPVIVSGAEAKSDKPPLLFEVSYGYKNHPHNQNIIIRDNCKFEGELNIPVLSRVQGDSENITLPPFLKRQDGLVPPPPPKKD